MKKWVSKSEWAKASEWVLFLKKPQYNHFTVHTTVSILNEWRCSEQRAWVWYTVPRLASAELAPAQSAGEFGCPLLGSCPCNAVCCREPSGGRPRQSCSPGDGTEGFGTLRLESGMSYWKIKLHWRLYFLFIYYYWNYFTSIKLEWFVTNPKNRRENVLKM